MNDFSNANHVLKLIIPYTSNVFIFSYPIYLFSLYVYWIFKKDIEHKYLTLYTCTSIIIWIGINLVIQEFINKIRPEQFLLKENIIFQHILNQPFPSDHATISSAIAISTLLWWMRYKQKIIIIIWTIFCMFSVIMSLSRISAWVHRPTDVISGTIIWSLISFLLIQKKVFSILKIYIFDWIIRFENVLIKKILWQQ